MDDRLHAVRKGRGQRHQVGRLLAGGEGLVDLDLDRGTLDVLIPEGADGLLAPVPLADRVQGRHADRILDHHVVGHQVEPILLRLAAHGAPRPACRHHGRMFFTHSRSLPASGWFRPLLATSAPSY